MRRSNGVCKSSPSAAFESLDVVMEKLGLEVEAMIRPPQFPKETKSWFALGGRSFV